MLHCENLSSSLVAECQVRAVSWILLCLATSFICNIKKFQVYVHIYVYGMHLMCRRWQRRLWTGKCVKVGHIHVRMQISAFFCALILVWALRIQNIFNASVANRDLIRDQFDFKIARNVRENSSKLKLRTVEFKISL